ncbi:MAG: hypothetical protein R6V61_03110 [Wenzhouxiangellaceae bacterium]
MKDFQQRYSAVFRRAARKADHCPSGDSLAMLAAGRAWPWQRRRLVDHIGRCGDCADDYRVLAAARSGLLDALEAHAGPASGHAPAWLPSGLAAAALAGVTALGIAVLVETGAPDSWSVSDTVAISDAERSPGGRGQSEDTLFKSDFGASEAADVPLFRDDFGS